MTLCFLEPSVLRIETLTKFSASLQKIRGGPSGQALADVVKLERLRRLKVGAGAKDVGILWDLLGFHGACDGFSWLFVLNDFKWMLGIKTSVTEQQTCIAVRTFGIIHVNNC